MGECSRRGFARSILALLFRPGPVSGATAPAPNLSLRRYRADCVILLFGIPIFRRAGVGGGQASVEEAADGTQSRTTLFFAGGSDPERAHGFVRLGWIREVALRSGAAPVEAEYFGVLTASPEESLDQARKTIAGPQTGRSLFSAVNGRHTAGHSRSAVTHFEFSSEATWSDRALIDQARATFPANIAWRDTSWPDSLDQPPPTFLLQLATLLKQRAKHASGRYVYNEQAYRMELDASPQRGPSGPLLAVRGSVQNERTGRQTAFRLWLDDSSGSIVPVRIEFQPRSFLRLTFEALPA